MNGGPAQVPAPIQPTQRSPLDEDLIIARLDTKPTFSSINTNKQPIQEQRPPTMLERLENKRVVANKLENNAAVKKYLTPADKSDPDVYVQKALVKAIANNDTEAIKILEKAMNDLKRINEAKTLQQLQGIMQDIKQSDIGAQAAQIGQLNDLQITAGRILEQLTRADSDLGDLRDRKSDEIGKMSDGETKDGAMRDLGAIVEIKTAIEDAKDDVAKFMAKAGEENTKATTKSARA